MVGNWPMKHDYTLTCMSKMTMCIQMIIKLLSTEILLKLMPKTFPQQTEYNVGKIVLVYTCKCIGFHATIIELEIKKTGNRYVLCDEL